MTTPLAVRLERLLDTVADIEASVRRGQRRDPGDRLAYVHGEIAAIRHQALRLAAATRGDCPNLADGQPDAPMTLERAADLLAGPIPNRSATT